MGCGGKSGGAALDGATQIRLEAGIHGIEQLSAGNDHDVETLAWRQEICTPENLSYQSLSAVSPHRITELARGHDPQPCDSGFVGSDEHRRVPSFQAKREVEHALELIAMPDPARLRESFGLPWHVSRIATPRAGLTRRKPCGAYALSPGAASAPAAHSS